MLHNVNRARFLSEGVSTPEAKHSPRLLVSNWFADFRDFAAFSVHARDFVDLLVVHHYERFVVHYANKKLKTQSNRNLTCMQCASICWQPLLKPTVSICNSKVRRQSLSEQLGLRFCFPHDLLFRYPKLRFGSPSIPAIRRSFRLCLRFLPRGFLNWKIKTLELSDI